MAEVQFLGFSTAGFPDPDVTRDVRPTNPPEVENFGVTQTIVSPGQDAGVLDAPDATFAKVPAPVPQSTSPAEGIKQPLSAPLRVPFVPPALVSTVLAFEATLDTLTGGLDPIFQFIIAGQFVRFTAETPTPALRGVARKILSVVPLVGPSSPLTSVLITLAAPLPVAPVSSGAGPAIDPLHDTFFVEEDPATIVAHLFGTDGIVAVTDDATILTTIPGKEVILS